MFSVVQCSAVQCEIIPGFEARVGDVEALLVLGEGEPIWSLEIRCHCIHKTFRTNSV